MSVVRPIDIPPSPWQRLMRLLVNEKKDIGYIYLYALVTGIISLSLPLGIQAVFNLVSGGLVFSSVYVLIGVVIFGVLAAGLLLVGQMALVEVLQQRIFAKAAFEFTYRLPRIEPEALEGYYPPELMNRFFDVLTIQKGLPKLLIDLTAATVQIIFGLILLSAYHPIFVGFGLFTVFMIWLLSRLYGPSGVRTSLNESKYKYKVVAWLEEIASNLSTFRNQPKATDHEPMDKMDELVANYVKYRNEHFKVLRQFFYGGVAFKTIVTGGLLILGTTLVVGREMSLGQFVAAELVIVLITGSVDKLISGIDTVFDLVTAVEKIGTVTDMPLIDQPLS
ncbi:MULTISPECIES: ABC transporter transmembrane domain-containing protein [unclassified Spirosoma]|uniref:ABC transporter transmembrane domain-containing protein n=1 Tax=unclassified Spirosoma TaxID=2621999 RepID=UPI00095EAB3A|nr:MULTISPECIES: ABC transporter transmembrane domain-containing protein [unclassified Spirosoma]MBN8825289.1 ABC transporter ATP-binding protein [Spirosoma sp.]OJW77537.1 MAG: ABC transporter [Spirosoma sp. 48-14]